MDRISTDHSPQDHAMRPGQLGMLGRSQDGMKAQADAFMSSQQLDAIIRKPVMVEAGRNEDFGMVDSKKLGPVGSGPDKLQKSGFNPNGPPGGLPPGGAMKRMGGGPDEKFMEQDNLKDLDFVNPLLYKPASKPPVIKEGDWLCPDPTNKTYMLSKLYEENNWSCPNCKNINKGERRRCGSCNEFKPNDIDEELKNTKHDQGMADGLGHDGMHDNDDDYNEIRYNRPPMRGAPRGSGGFRGFSGGRGGHRDSRGGRGGGNRAPPNRGGPARRGGGYQGGGGRYGPPGGYDGDMDRPDGGYMNDFGRNGPPSRGGMMRGGRSGFPPGPHQQRPQVGSAYMDNPFDDDSRGGGEYTREFRERSRSQEKNHEGSGNLN